MYWNFTWTLLPYDIISDSTRSRNTVTTLGKTKAWITNYSPRTSSFSHSFEKGDYLRCLNTLVTVYPEHKNLEESWTRAQNRGYWAQATTVTRCRKSPLLHQCPAPPASQSLSEHLHASSFPWRQGSLQIYLHHLFSLSPTAPCPRVTAVTLFPSSADPTGSAKKLMWKHLHRKNSHFFLFHSSAYS